MYALPFHDRYYKSIKKYKAPSGNYFDGDDDAVIKFFADLQHDLGHLKTESMSEHVMPSATHQSENYAASSMYTSYKASNDDGENWCESTELYDENNAGTPGAPNNDCGR